MNDDEFHGKFKDNLKDGSDEEKKKFLDICNYVPGAYDQDDAFQNLNKEIEKKEKDIGAKEPNREQGPVAARMMMVRSLTLISAPRHAARPLLHGAAAQRLYRRRSRPQEELLL